MAVHFGQVTRYAIKGTTPVVPAGHACAPARCAGDPPGGGFLDELAGRWEIAPAKWPGPYRPPRPTRFVRRALPLAFQSAGNPHALRTAAT